MEVAELRKLIERLVSLSKESETVEFKENFHSKEEIGERISALSNSACLLNQPYSYLVFGIENNSHKITGTAFRSKNRSRRAQTPSAPSPRTDQGRAGSG